LGEQKHSFILFSFEKTLKKKQKKKRKKTDKINQIERNLCFKVNSQTGRMRTTTTTPTTITTISKRHKSKICSICFAYSTI